MIKIKSKIIILLIALSLIGCGTKNRKNIIVNSFPINSELIGNVVEISVNTLNPSGICTISDKLVIYDDVGNDLFKVFNLPNLNYLFSWGNTGRGPDEFIFIDNNYIRAFKNELELLDNGTIKHFLVTNNSFTKKDLIKLPRLSNPINNLQKINDSIYIADNIFTDIEFEHILLNINNHKVINKFGKYPDGLNISNSTQNYEIYSKLNISSQYGEKFIVFYIYFNIIKIYNSQGDIQKTIILRDIEINNYSIENRIKNPIYFGIPYATERYFYVLRMNMCDDDIIKNIEQFKPDLLIWDWDGTPVAKYKLDKPVIRFAVSEKFKKLYGTSIIKENEIYVYDLQGVSFDSIQ